MAQPGSLYVDTDELYKHAMNLSSLARSLNISGLDVQAIDNMGTYWKGKQYDDLVKTYRWPLEQLGDSVVDLIKLADQILAAAITYRNMLDEVNDVMETRPKG